MLDNYWGVRELDGGLTVLQCPKGYCCSSQSTPCVSYDTCSKGRRGTLCGRCEMGYMQSFLTDECIPLGSDNCNILVFALYFWLTSCLYTFIFTYLPPIVEKLKKIPRKKVPKATRHHHCEENDIEESTNGETDEAKGNTKDIPMV